MRKKGEPPCLMQFVYSLGIGGAERLVFDLVAGLPAGKYRPIVVCVGTDGRLHETFERRGVAVYQRPWIPGETWRTVSWVREVIAREDVRIIHAHQYNPLQFSVLAAFDKRRVNLIYTEHGRIHPEVWQWKRYLTNPLFALRIDHIVSISESTRLAMQRYDNLPGRRIRVVRNGVRVAGLKPGVDRHQLRRSLNIGEQSRIIGTAGRLEEVKNLPMLLRGFRTVLSSFPDTVLLIAGEGPQRGELEAQAAALGVAEQVRFLGLRDDLPALLELMELFLLVSFTEGISVALLEALGSGVPAVVTRTGGNPEVVLEGVNGYLVEVGDAEAMAQKVVALLADPARAQALGERGRERVAREFSFESMIESYMGMYDGEGER